MHTLSWHRESWNVSDPSWKPHGWFLLSLLEHDWTKQSFDCGLNCFERAKLPTRSILLLPSNSDGQVSVLPKNLTGPFRVWQKVHPTSFQVFQNIASDLFSRWTCELYPLDRSNIPSHMSGMICNVTNNKPILVQFSWNKGVMGKIEASGVHALKMENCLFNNVVKDVCIFYRMCFLCHIDGCAKCIKQLVKLVSNSEHMSVERVHFNEAFRGCTCSQKMRALIWQSAPLSDT